MNKLAYWFEDNWFSIFLLVAMVLMTSVLAFQPEGRLPKAICGDQVYYDVQNFNKNGQEIQIIYQKNGESFTVLSYEPCQFVDHYNK